MNLTSKLIEAHIFRVVGNELEFLLLKRSMNEVYPGLWQMVTGSIEGDEKAFQTALREIKEETELTPLRFWVVPHVNTFYSPKDDEIYLIPVFVALVSQQDSVSISEEHSEFKWVSREEALSLLAWPGQRTSVETICEYFNNQKYFLNFTEITL